MCVTFGPHLSYGPSSSSGFLFSNFCPLADATILNFPTLNQHLPTSRHHNRSLTVVCILYEPIPPGSVPVLCANSCRRNCLEHRCRVVRVAHPHPRNPRPTQSRLSPSTPEAIQAAPFVWPILLIEVEVCGFGVSGWRKYTSTRTIFG